MGATSISRPSGGGDFTVARCLRAQRVGESFPAGHKVHIVDGKIAESQRVRDPLLDTSWVHEVLILKGDQSPELQQRIDDIWAQIGDTKMSYLYEEEVRRLGDACVTPLVRFIESSRSQSDERKDSAARIVG
jgi:hypothetical protein